MPGLMSVAEFLQETREDYNSPTTSTFVSKMPQCRQTIAALEDTLDFDRDGLTKMKKAVKAIFNSGNLHVDNEVYLSRALEKLGGNALTKDQEPDIGAAFLKFSVVTKELSALMKTVMQNINNIVMFPVDNLLKGDLRGVKGDLKRPFDKAWKDYETKMNKLEKEKKQQAKEAGLIRTEVTPAEIADEMEKERKVFQLQMCEYLIKVNEIKTKKGVELLQHLVEYYHAQTNFFQDGLKTIEHFSGYIGELSAKLQKIRQKQDEERKRLIELKSLLKNSPSFDKDQACSTQSGYSLHQLQGNKSHGDTKTGHLLKKSEGKVRKVWQKRRCEIKDGFLFISHSDETKPPTKLNLLTCQVKMVPEDKRCFDLVSYSRTYHFQAEDEVEMEAWMSVLINCKEGALMKAFDDCGKPGTKVNQSLVELQQSIIRHIQRLPGNDRCCDCNSQNDPTWLSTNFGILTCIECSGIHRDMGVHISRIQSLTLDNIGTSQLLLARVMTNAGFNDVMEATLNQPRKPNPDSTMEERYEFIRAKYVEKKFSIRTCADSSDLLNDLDHAANSRHIYQLLQAFVEGVDLTSVLPSSKNDETSLHVAVAHEDGTSLHIVDFLVQNSSTLDKQTKDGNTALHLCAMQNRSECMKLLLRSGANPNIENAQQKTPIDIVKERGYSLCQELLSHAIQNKKELFENVSVEWSLTQDDGLTDISDDEVDDRVPTGGSSTPEKRIRSRPPSFAGADSPCIRSRASTADSSRSGCSPVAVRSSMPPPPPPQNKKPIIPGLNSHGSIKKRAAPPPPVYSQGHNRTPSDPVINNSPAMLNNNNNNNHKRTPSTDSTTSAPNGTTIALPPKVPLSTSLPTSLGPQAVIPASSDFSSLKNMNEKSMMYSSGSLQRPKGPPPPTPPTHNPTNMQTMANGQSNESLCSVTSNTSDLEIVQAQANQTTHAPVPPPRKRLESTKPRRCRALYDCDADNEDELSFQEGEVIIILNDQTDDENWMEGMVEGQPHRKGMFPVSFVHMLSD